MVPSAHVVDQGMVVDPPAGLPGERFPHPWAAYPACSPRSVPHPMGRTLENKQQIVEELKGLLGEAELALVLDFKGLTIKEMSDLRTRLQASNGVCKVTKNTLMRRAIDGDSAWSELESLLTGTNAFILVKGDVGGAVKAVQSFQKDKIGRAHV